MAESDRAVQELHALLRASYTTSLTFAKKCAESCKDVEFLGLALVTSAPHSAAKLTKFYL